MIVANNNTEQLGVAAVNAALGVVPNLGPNVDQMDRTPLTDGYIDLFGSDDRHTVKNLLGRVYPQVKTSNYPKKSAIPKTYSLKRETLVGYRNLAGVLFFHVGLTGARRKPTIMFANLTPFTIDRLLASVPDTQKSISFRIKPFPPDRAAIERIVRFQWETQAESAVIGFDPTLLEDGALLTIRSNELFHFDRPILLDDPDRTFSVLLTTKEGMELPFKVTGSLTPANYLPHEIEIEFTSGDVTFTRGIRKQLTPRSFEIRLSDGLLVTFEDTDAGLKTNVQLDPQPDLQGRLKDLEFGVALEVNGWLRIQGREATIRQPSSESELLESLEHLRKIHRTLLELGADLTLVSLVDMTGPHYAAVLGIHDILFEGEPLPTQYRGTLRIRQSIGDWALDLLVVPDGEDRWRLGSLVQLQQAYQLTSVHDGEERAFLATPYDVLDPDLLAKTLNLDLGNVTSYYENIRTLPDTVDMARGTVLKFIRAADTEPRRREQFLDAAADLSRWLKEVEPDQPRDVLNALQIKARREGLTAEDRVQLRALRRTANRAGDPEALEIAAGCSILLDDFDEARELLASLSPESQQTFLSWPIAVLLPQAHDDEVNGAEPQSDAEDDADEAEEISAAEATG